MAHSILPKARSAAALYQFTHKSTNRKTGPLPVTMTAPESCPLRGAGCYAQQGMLGVVWRQVGRPATHSRAPKSLTIERLCELIAALPEGQLWRHNQAGDLPGRGGALDVEALRAIVGANVGRRGFTVLG